MTRAEAVVSSSPSAIQLYSSSYYLHPIPRLLAGLASATYSYMFPGLKRFSKTIFYSHIFPKTMIVHVQSSLMTLKKMSSVVAQELE